MMRDLGNKPTRRLVWYWSPLMASLGMWCGQGMAAQAQQPTSVQPLFLKTVPPTHTFRMEADAVLGTSLTMVVQTATSQQAHRVWSAVMAEIARLDKILSIWRADSEISQLNAVNDRCISSDLYAVLEACEQWRLQTDGAFNARLGAIFNYWQHQHAIAKKSPVALQQWSRTLDQAHVVLQPKTRRALKPTHMQFAPDGYAKGYIIDRALDAAQRAEPALQGLMLDIGGDIRVWGQSPESGGWRIAVRDPFVLGDSIHNTQILHLKQQAVAFSGQGARDWHGHAHLIDAKTGAPLDHIEQCVVVGDCAADADALATALAAMPVEQALALLGDRKGYEAQWVTRQGQRYQSAGWSALLADPAPQWQEISSAASSSLTSWPTGYQAKLDLTLPKIQGGKAPYVSVWITDAERRKVRTLAIWGKDPKWLDSNYIWWRRYGRNIDRIDSVAQPSRQAGQYRLFWDGKDDAGQLVGAGQYVLHIEVSREHGTHTYQTLNLPVAAQPHRQQYAAKDELGELTLVFDRPI